MEFSERQRSAELSALLKELSCDDLSLDTDEKRQLYFIKLEKIYYISPDRTYRHLYSEIFSNLVMIQRTDESDQLDILSENLKSLATSYIPLNHDPQNGHLIAVGDCIKKLYDHVNLEIMRMRYSDMGDKEISDLETIKELNRKIQLLQSDLATENEAIEVLRTREKQFTDNLQSDFHSAVDKNKVDFIGVLGLFSGIIITFVAGLVFSGSILQNIHQASIYRISFVILVLALFIFNIIYICFFFIIRIGKKESTKSMITPLISVNIVLVLLIGAVAICYWNGIVEKRDKRITSDQQSTVSVTNPAS